MKFKVITIIQGPGGVVEAPLAHTIVADSMKEAMKVGVFLIVWPTLPFKVIGIKITEAKDG